jgi:hypothetical protein
MTCRIVIVSAREPGRQPCLWRPVKNAIAGATRIAAKKIAMTNQNIG